MRGKKIRGSRRVQVKSRKELRTEEVQAKSQQNPWECLVTKTFRVLTASGLIESIRSFLVSSVCVTPRQHNGPNASEEILVSRSLALLESYSGSYLPSTDVFVCVAPPPQHMSLFHQQAARLLADPLIGFGW